MSRYGPPVFTEDRSGELLAQALTNAVGNYTAGRRQKTLDQQRAEDRRLQLYGQGIREGTAPAEDSDPGATIGAAPTRPFLPTGEALARHLSAPIRGDTIEQSFAESGDQLASALPASGLSISPQRPASSPPSFTAPAAAAMSIAPPAAPAPTPGHPGAFDPGSGTFRDGKGLPKMPGSPPPTSTHGTRYEQIDPGHYIDRQATPDALADQRESARFDHGKQLEREFAAQDRTRKISDYMSAGYSPMDAAMAVDNPTMADNVWDRSHPKPAAVKDAGVVNPQAGTIEDVYTDGSRKVIRRATAAEIKKATHVAADPSIDAGVKFQSDQKNKILDDYARDTKDFHQVMAGWDVLQGAVKNPSLATPFAITDAYARITNPGAVVRPTTMEMIHDMGSVGQRIEKWMARNTEGALPAEIVKDFQRTLYGIVAEHKKQYDQIRTKAIRRGHEAGVDVDPLLEDYAIEDPLAATPAPAGADGKKPAPLNPWRKP